MNDDKYFVEQEYTTLSGISFGELLSLDDVKDLTCPYTENLSRGLVV